MVEHFYTEECVVSWKTRNIGMLLVVCVLLASGNAWARKGQWLNQLMQPQSTVLPAAGQMEVAFSPDEGGEALVIKVIDSARREIRMLAYSFTSAPVTFALLRAQKRGVNIELVVDHKSNVAEGGGKGKARAALSSLVNAGCDVRTISVYAIHHDKVIIVDGATVETGSFNYSSAAAHKNSENVLVNWNNPQLASVYLQHFARNYAQAVPYQTQY